MIGGAIAISAIVAGQLRGYYESKQLHRLKTDMIAPTGLYDSFSSITASEAADKICDAIVRRPKRIMTPMGAAAELSSSVAPETWDVWQHLAYRLFPDSAAARGDLRVEHERPTSWGRIFARLLPGVHW